MNSLFLRLGAPILFILLTLTGGPSAHAQASLEDQWNSYTQAKSQGKRLQATVYLAQIKKEVFNGTYGESYIQKLKTLDGLAERNPGIGYDVAKTLQLHWEAKFAPELNTRNFNRIKSSTEVGAVLGMTALGFSLLKKPYNAPKYFRLMRHLLPVIGTVAGKEVGHALNRSHWLDQDIPLAPAQVMRLGVISETPPALDEFTEDLIALTASTAVASIAYDLFLIARGARAVNLAATPFKIHPVALALSVAVGFLVEEGIGWAAETIEWNTIQKNLNEAKLRFERAILAKNHLEALRASEALTQTVMASFTSLAQPIYSRVEEYAQEVAELDPKRDAREIHTRSEELAQDLRDHYRKKYQSTYTSEDDSLAVLDVLLDSGRAGIDQMDEELKWRAETYVGTFDVMMKYDSEKRKDCQKKLDQCLEAHLRRTSSELSSRFASDFRMARFPKEPRYLLLAASEFLKEYRQDYLQEPIDVLTTHFFRYRQLLRQVRAF